MCVEDNIFSDDWENTNAGRSVNIWFDHYFKNVSDDATDKYDVIYGYSDTVWSEYIAAKRHIDTKAEGILRFGAASATVVIALAKLNSVPNWVAFTPFGFFCIAAAFSLAATRITIWPHPLPIKEALLRLAEFHLGTQKAMLAANIHRAAVGYEILLRRRAKLLGCAYTFTAVGILSLALFLFF
jgi:hypothetical protein